nr:hypothetical protein [Paraburkholderia sp. BL8N3]
MMALEQVKRVVETIHVDQLNRYLAAGWTLLTTASLTNTDEYQRPVVMYSVGWAQDGEPVEPKLY